MENKKVLKDKRGISYVMAVFLVAIITLAAAIMLYGWAGGFIGATTPVPGEVRESIAIEAGILNLADARDPSTGTKDGVYDIRYWHYCTANTGPVDVEVEAMYISDTDGNVIYHLSTTELKEAGYAIYRINTGDFDVSAGEPNDGVEVDYIMFGPLKIPAGNSRCFEGSVAINVSDMTNIAPENLNETFVSGLTVTYNTTIHQFCASGYGCTSDYEYFHGEGGAKFEVGKVYIVKLTTTNGAAASISVKAAEATA